MSPEQLPSQEQKELERLRQVVEVRDKRIEELERHLNILYHSKFVRPAIQFRLLVLPFYTKFRRLFSKYVPHVIRRTLKALLFRRSVPQKVMVENEPWKPNAPLVTVVTPYYNRAHTIDETVKSVFAQTFQDFEYILVDDGSTEEASIRKLDELAQAYPQLTIIRKKNGGLGPARNTGIEAGRGKYVACIDSDDRYDPTFLEKCVTVLETNPNAHVVTSHMQFFGIRDEVYKEGPYNPVRLMGVENMLHCASMFRRADWQEIGGFKNIGHEDWEFWINLAEHNHFGARIPEPIFWYRKAEQSMFVEELKRTKENVRNIRQLHPEYLKKVKAYLKERAHRTFVVSRKTAYVNLSRPGQFLQAQRQKKHVLIAIPFMTFGGAETLIYNYAKQLREEFRISFMTFVPANNEWEKKFKEVSDAVYHLPHLFEHPEDYLEFMANYIETHHVDILHVIHNGHVYDLLPELKRRFPLLAIIVTLFNDRAHFTSLPKYDDYIDAYSADNQKVLESIRTKLKVEDKPLVAIPNGIDCEEKFNPGKYPRDDIRKSLGLSHDDFVVTFVGRLSHEKKPDAFLAVAEKVLADSRFSRAQFLMVGDGPMKSLVEKTIHEIGSPRIQFLGYRSDIPEILSVSRVLVISSTIEGSPQTMFEAAAMGVVVVASDVGGVSEILEHEKTGYLVPPASVDDIVSALERLYDDTELLMRLSGNARALMQSKYSILHMKDGYKKLYQEI